MFFMYTFLGGLDFVSNEGNTEEENNDYVVFKWNIRLSAWKKGGEGRGILLRPPPPPTAFYSRRLRLYSKRNMWYGMGPYAGADFNLTPTHSRILSPAFVTLCLSWL